MLLEIYDENYDNYLNDKQLELDIKGIENEQSLKTLGNKKMRIVVQNLSNKWYYCSYIIKAEIIYDDI